ncbi:hypothetical protein ASG29_12945 [Sphingomonas sp. Leaf412]|uniref:hypothetical protein n=1 Tax=Sphingomonas sp. Leaf412 TaxID=1736370 RepID=UPI0006FB9BCF|nr:hypothetical protein [Sphingomonas sp. Leaf412]KQT32641.1 hypothetical protein ASG29_12945 [Sphingomonas sp. Leaf412]
MTTPRHDGMKRAMMERNTGDSAAAALVAAHGTMARQKVVDHIMAAIRAHDLTAAKRWDEIGRMVDQRLAA